MAVPNLQASQHGLVFVLPSNPGACLPGGRVFRVFSQNSESLHMAGRSVRQKCSGPDLASNHGHFIQPDSVATRLQWCAPGDLDGWENNPQLIVQTVSDLAKLLQKNLPLRSSWTDKWIESFTDL